MTIFLRQNVQCCEIHDFWKLLVVFMLKCFFESKNFTLKSINFEIKGHNFGLESWFYPPKNKQKMCNSTKVMIWQKIEFFSILIHLIQTLIHLFLYIKWWLHVPKTQNVFVSVLWIWQNQHFYIQKNILITSQISLTNPNFVVKFWILQLFVIKKHSFFPQNFIKL